MERYSKLLQRQWGKGCWLWCRGIAAIRHQNPDLVTEKAFHNAHKYFRASLSSLDVELNAYIDGNVRRQAHWKIMQSIFLRDLVTIQSSIYQISKQKESKYETTVSSSRVVDLDDDEAFTFQDTNHERQLELLVLNIVQSIQIIEGELQNVLQYFIGTDVSRIHHLLRPENASSSASSFSFPTLQVATYDIQFLLQRLSILFVSIPGSTTSLVPASSLPIVTLPDVLSVYLSLQTGYLDLLRNVGQLSIALKMTKHFLYSLGTIIGFLSLMNQAVRMQASQFQPNTEEEEEGKDTSEHQPASRDIAQACHRVLSVLLHALRRHRAILAFKYAVLEDRLLEQSSLQSSSLATALQDISLFEPFEIEGFEENNRKLSGVDQRYEVLDKQLRKHLSQFPSANDGNISSSAYQSKWMQRLVLTRAVCEELAGLHDWMHTSNIAEQLTRDMFAALHVTPYNHSHSLYPATVNQSNAAVRDSLVWIVSNSTDRSEVAELLLALYELQSRAYHELVLQQERQADLLQKTIGSLYYKLLLQCVRSRYQAGLVALLWAANMPETARRLLERAEEACKPLVSLLKSSSSAVNSPVKQSAQAGVEVDVANPGEKFESMLLCSDIAFHLGLAYFQGGMLSDAVTTTLAALKHVELAHSLTSKTHPAPTNNKLGPYVTDDANDDNDEEQVLLRKRHMFSQLVWIYSALENHTAAETALQSLRAITLTPEEIPRLCMMILQRLGMRLSGLPTAAAAAVPAPPSTSPVPASTASEISQQEVLLKKIDTSTSSASQDSNSASTAASSSANLTHRRAPGSSSAPRGNDTRTTANNASTKPTTVAKPPKPAEPTDIHFVVSIGILIVFGVAMLYVLLRIMRWDEQLFGGGAESDWNERDMFEL